MAVTYRTTLEEPNGRRFTKTTRRDTNAAALAEHTAVLAITAGVVVADGQSFSQPPVAPIPANAATSYSDATFHFRNGSENVNVHFEQLSNQYAAVDSDGNETGYVDISNAAIQAYADSFNGGGYTLVEARYVK